MPARPVGCEASRPYTTVSQEEALSENHPQALHSSWPWVGVDRWGSVSWCSLGLKGTWHLTASHNFFFKENVKVIKRLPSCKPLQTNTTTCLDLNNIQVFKRRTKLTLFFKISLQSKIDSCLPKYSHRQHRPKSKANSL